MRTNLTFPTTSRGPSLNTRKLCTAKGTTLKNFPLKLRKLLCRNRFFKDIEVAEKTRCFFGVRKAGVEYFSNSAVLYPKGKVRLLLYRARPIFCNISDNHKGSLEMVDSLLYTRRNDFKDEYHKKTYVLAYNPFVYYSLEILGKLFNIRARQIQFIHDNVFDNASVRRISITINTNFAFTGSYNKTTFWLFDLRQFKNFRGGQPLVDIDVALIVFSTLQQWKQWIFKMVSPLSNW